MIKKCAKLVAKELRNFIIVIAGLALIVYLSSLFEPAPKTYAELKKRSDHQIFIAHESNRVGNTWQ